MEPDRDLVEEKKVFLHQSKEAFDIHQENYEKEIENIGDHLHNFVNEFIDSLKNLNQATSKIYQDQVVLCSDEIEEYKEIFAQMNNVSKLMGEFNDQFTSILHGSIVNDNVDQANKED